MSLIAFTGCNHDNDDDSRAFMSTATITGDSINGYFCYLDGGGLVISYDQSLKGIERGYFNFNYTENDWTTSPDGMKYINNAQVGAWSVYDVICPIDKNTFERTDDADKYNHQIPSLMGMSTGYRGYFDLNLGITTLNATNEKVRATLKLVYDPAEQNPDTLHLQLYYNLNIPENWVPAIQLVSFDEADYALGFLNLRFRLNDYLLEKGGHIGYSIRPSERGKGYAKESLRQGLQVAKDKNIHRALVTCSIKNPASRAVILANGGQLENIRHETERYWIDLE